MILNRMTVKKQNVWSLRPHAWGWPAEDWFDSWPHGLGLGISDPC